MCFRCFNAGLLDGALQLALFSCAQAPLEETLARTACYVHSAFVASGAVQKESNINCSYRFLLFLSQEWWQ